MVRKGTGKDIAKGTLRKEIRTYIQEQIASGRFKAGDRIVETQLAKELNVSQAPVREAILELAAMGQGRRTVGGEVNFGPDTSPPQEVC